MRYLSFRDPDGRVRVGVADPGENGTLRDCTDLLPPGAGSPMRRLIAASGDLDRGPGLAARIADAPAVPRSGVEILPVVPDPSKVVAAPVNYRAHQAEMNEASQIGSLGVFLKAPSSVAADRGVVRLPYHDRRFDQEGELAAVIGRTARSVDESEALDVVFGYTGLLDMTMRGGEDRSLRKSFDTFTPLGPTVVTRDEVPPLDDLELHLWVNDTLRQRADLRDLIWGLPRLIAYVSSVMTLSPGDIVSTGTPEGVGEVVDGDRIELRITGLDRLTATVSDLGAVTCPTHGAGRGPVPPGALTPVTERRS